MMAMISPLAVSASDETTITGVVRDTRGTPIPKADAHLLTPQDTVVGSTVTDSGGRFSLPRDRKGGLILLIAASGFSEARIAVRGSDAGTRHFEVILEPRTIQHSVTVTADVGLAEDTHLTVQGINIINRDEIEERAKSGVAQTAQEEAGVHLQRTSPTIAGIFVRGLTGNKVSVFVDGVRYTTSAQRGGINTFLGLMDPSSLQSMEILRGSNSAQYGSDAIGGSLHLLSRAAHYSTSGRELGGRMSYFANSADASFGSEFLGSYSTPKFGVVTALNGRRNNTLRPGKGKDSHAAVTRFFGLPSSLFEGSRLPDTGFTQYGGLVKLRVHTAPGSQWRLHYHRSQQDGGKRYDQMLGGDGNLIADLRNLMLDFFYVRFDALRLGPLQDFNLTYSFNSQREERVNQGGNGNRLARVQHDRERTTVHGIQSQAAHRRGLKHILFFGGEYHREGIRDPAFAFDPASGRFTAARPRVPDRARYWSGGVYAQSVFEPVLGRFRLVGNIRQSYASYRSRAADSPLVGGAPLWPDDRMSVSATTFRGGVSVTVLEGLTLVASVSRGFRAPHVTDLGTLGLSGSGFEVAAADLAGRKALIGTTSDRTAASTGRDVAQVEPERSLAYEFGIRYRNTRVDTDLNLFLNEIDGILAKQALILPGGAVGTSIGGHRIVEQTAAGAVFVDASPTPVLVRTNLGTARIRGIEHTFDWRIESRLALRTVFTYVRAEDATSGAPPDIEGGILAPDGYVKLRYSSPGGRVWLEPYAHAAGRQSRLSSLDLEDRRTGGTRSRSGIRNFFFNGATNRGWVEAGPDGMAGTADDRLIATGETFAQIQDRVLGPGNPQSPLFRAVAGYFTLGLRGGFRLGEKNDVLWDLENITDRNYRGISWGMDAPGRSIYVRFTRRF
jgi:hemoglobin/transferrin/lactoferrin receptor protein